MSSTHRLRHGNMFRVPKRVQEKEGLCVGGGVGVSAFYGRCVLGAASFRANERPVRFLHLKFGD